MRGRVLPAQKLRGQDSTMLQVQLADAFGLPISQIHPENVLDILALSELEEPPATLRSQLAAFSERVPREIADLPNGQSWEAYIAELAQISAARVPNSFRQMLEAELQKDTRDAGPAFDLLASWTDTSPLAFELGTSGQTRVTRGAAVKRREASTASKPKSRGAASASGASGPAKKPARSKPPVDIDRENWVQEQVMDRLSGLGEKGLSETVLLAGIRNRAKASYPNLMPYEILRVLKDLKEKGTVRFSAGRWKLPERW